MTRKWSTKRGGEHHIATGHGPMVQGGLLMAHSGGVHEDGGAPEGGSSFRQGAGGASPGSPRYREEIGEKTSILGVSSAGVIYRRRGSARGSTREPGAPWRGQPLG